MLVRDMSKCQIWGEDWSALTGLQPPIVQTRRWWKMCRKPPTQNECWLQGVRKGRRKGRIKKECVERGKDRTWGGCKDRLEVRCESTLMHLFPLYRLLFNLVQHQKSFKILTVKRLNFTYFMIDFCRLWHRWAHCLQMTVSGARSRIELTKWISL